ncbi:MAG: hypothetical protein ACHQ4J_14910 [Candidatus Binatia bacterium]
MKKPTVGLSAENLLGHALALAVAVTLCQGTADAQNAIDGGGTGAPVLVVNGAHASYAATDVRADAAPELYQGTTADVLEAPLGGASGAGLVINATFDSSITSNPSSAAIAATINSAIGILQSLFSDPIIVNILFRYSTTAPNGTPLPAGALAYSLKGLLWRTMEYLHHCADSRCEDGE